ncbi:MAG TPA: phosphoribosyltransferase family protein [Nitrososphaeraceae archaeon]|nr:phosphoribosyltransferase family protein [Nitrososphaeraceae archaeon]
MEYLKEKEEIKNVLVLAIPRGGIIVANIIAKKLKTDKVDIIIPRKLVTPHNKENAFGAIMEDGSTFIDERVVDALSISNEYIEQEKDRQLKEIRRRALVYKNSENLLDYSNKINDQNRTVILVDDGAASGATLIVAARWIKNRKEHQFKKLIIAIPVAPKETANTLKGECDHLEIITKPSLSKFQTVSQYYKDFNPITDEQVVEILKKWNNK